MKKIFYLLLLGFVFVKVQAQIINPVKWEPRIEKKSTSEYVLTFNGNIEAGWHVYSQFTPEDGPLPAEFIFHDNKSNYEFIGKATESETKREFNEIFGVDEIFFSDKVTFTQLIKQINPEKEIIQVELSYQVCKENCISETKYFEFNLKTLEAKEIQAADIVNEKTTKTDANSTIEKQPESKESDSSLYMIFFIAFLSGFAALLTPCVFPMIPMTVSFFTKQSKTKAKGIKNAIIYGISIILIYVFLGTVITLIFGADALNALSTNVWFNVIFFVLLVVFSLSFLGAFEIMLPNSWANKVDRQADKGGILGIVFMALALAIVSFSCTGPIIGTLLVEAASKGGIAPIVGMLGFSFALALPFMLFAMFPGWLNTLPKSGGWLNTVKVFLGFIELALAFKFLSNADLVLQLHWFEREIFLAIWIAIFGTLAFYLFGKITLPHDSPSSSISVGRLSVGLLILVFTIYLIPGLWGAPLKLISGFPPPMTYSESPYGVGGSNRESTSAIALPDGAHKGPHDIMAFTDYEKGLAYAKSVNKPILLDFTGFACVNCRKMEDYVWSDPRILSILNNEVVLISLYVDDKRELPIEEQYVSKETGKKIKSIGNKWSDFQITRYKANAQPYYIILDTKEKSLNQPVGYMPDITEYEQWLKYGIKQFQK
ncbi:MAG: cytochrome c biogenesis protein CcdA [Flavobacterium sp.]|jgi:thiol:disulfide interchange protein DsbD|uniref:Thiol:disulfide interchange protein n=2 Tax=Flavobacterium TaxID=237 RepID=A0A366B0C6_9FLAO|nr:MULTISPECIES: thioredoxin family protein [Flavobacterium]MBC5864293.1 thioredoxin family protein [Flavobacterium turcicum]MDP3682112.1 cytochrome c biogenesis protein CcdA [Flavobacterium sp.]NHL02933.1 thioredoxin fold domain-containing protein [Flavobacterium turcicum]RBN50562.1 thiol:disulfide interchange protein [Flavobacterium psychrolimnae]|tara:strand:+ start:4234 stop:6204 length:1971 start_codon:yes stop_codon:yes gene_type:complete